MNCTFLGAVFKFFPPNLITRNVAKNRANITSEKKIEVYKSILYR